MKGTNKTDDGKNIYFMKTLKSFSLCNFMATLTGLVNLYSGAIRDFIEQSDETGLKIWGKK